MKKVTKIRIQAVLLSLSLIITSTCSPISMVKAALDSSRSVVTEEVIEMDETEEASLVGGIVKDLTPVIAISDIAYNETFVGNGFVEEKVEESIIEPVVEEPSEPVFPITEEEIRLIAILTMGEAEGESELGKRLVIDTVLNRLDSEKYPNTVHGVVYSGAYTAMHNGRVDVCYPREDIVQLVKEELISRTNSKVLYFRTKHFHNFGTPEIHEGNHYFSS